MEISQRNKFFVGDTLDVLEPGGKPFLLKAERIFDQWGNEVESTPHAMQKLFVPVERKVLPGAYLRKKR